MALCIECLTAVQELPGLTPDWDAPVSELYTEDVGEPGQAPTVSFIFLKKYTWQLYHHLDKRFYIRTE